MKLLRNIFKTKQKMAIDKDVIALITKQIDQQVADAIQQAIQKIQGSTQEKSSVVDSVTQNKQEEINSGEAHRASVLSQTRVWNHNDKWLVEKEQSHDNALKSIQIQEAKQAAAHKAKLDHLEITAARNAQVVEHLANTLAVAFQTAAAHPFSPNDQDKDAK